MFCAVVCAVVGVLLHRLEGPIELSPTSLRATLRRAQSVAGDENLTLEEKGDALVELVESVSASERRLEEPRKRSSGVQVVTGAPLSSLPVISRFVLSNVGGIGVVPRGESRRFEEHVKSAFEDAGWVIERLTDHDFDFRADKGPVRAYVEVKLRLNLGAADARLFLQLVDWRLAAGRGGRETPRFLLVVAEGALSSGAKRELEERDLVTVLEVGLDRR